MTLKEIKNFYLSHNLIHIVQLFSLIIKDLEDHSECPLIVNRYLKSLIIQKTKKINNKNNISLHEVKLLECELHILKDTLKLF